MGKALTIFLMCTTASAFGQVDTLPASTPPKRPDPTIPTSTQPQLPPADHTSLNPLIRIRIDEAPSTMREILQREGYQGWETAPIYLDRQRLEYSIDIRSGDSLRTFKFDKSGYPLNVNYPYKDDFR